jgi:hypothetical protein
LLDHAAIGGAKHEQGAVGRISERPGEQQFAAGLGVGARFST